MARPRRKTASSSSLVPGCVVVVTAAPGDELAPLLPGEDALVAGAVPTRRAEFTAGRACARAGLRRLGFGGQAILSDPRRAPQWPAEVVGSITHCAGFTAAAVALRREVTMLGIDAERVGGLDDDDRHTVIAPDELRRAGDEIGELAGLVLFSAKESIYKAWYPVTGRWLEFTDVVVGIDTAGTFAVHPGPHLAEDDRALLTSLRGRFDIADDLVVTAAHAPA